MFAVIRGRKKFFMPLSTLKTENPIILCEVIMRFISLEITLTKCWQSKVLGLNYLIAMPNVS